MRTEFENEQKHTTQVYSSKTLYALEKSGKKIESGCMRAQGTKSETDLPTESLKLLLSAK